SLHPSPSSFTAIMSARLLCSARSSARAASLVCSLGLISSAAAQSVPGQATRVQRAPGVELFPLELRESAGPLDSFQFASDLDAIEALGAHRELSMPGVPLSNGTSVVLDLERIDFDFSSIGVHVNGQRSLWNSGDLTVWKGAVHGDPFSHVTVGFSSLGSYGWISTAGETWHLASYPDPVLGWDQPGSRIWAESASAAAGFQDDRPTCIADTVADHAPASQADPFSRQLGSASAGTLRECTIAIETDFQLFQLFGDLAAEQNYMGMLLAAISDRFEEQIDVVLTYPYVMYHTTVNDGWDTPDNGGGTIDMLNEFVAAWSGNIPSNASLAHFISGENLGGGVAYLDVLCNTAFGFGVSANLGAAVNFPVTQGAGNWDFFVICHELGHNFSSPHTFDYSPQIDDCPTTCTNMGTMMSYCHLCSGGVNNITPFFHPRVVDQMRSAVAGSCLPPYSGGLGSNFCSPNPNSTGVASQMSAAGSPTVADNDVTLTVTDLPISSFGFFVVSDAQGFVANPGGSAGNLCVSGSIGRFVGPGQIQTSSAAGEISLTVDLNQIPQPMAPVAAAPGDIWNFQLWHRDTDASGSPTSNFSD
ncbi:MAG: M12 family metallo-peptidase, partial [Planctomycetota bacterium]